MDKIKLNWMMKLIASGRPKKNIIFWADEIAKAFRDHHELILEQALLKLLENRLSEVQYIAYCELKFCYQNVSEPGRQKLGDYEKDDKDTAIIEKAEREYAFAPCPNPET